MQSPPSLDISFSLLEGVRERTASGGFQGKMKKEFLQKLERFQKGIPIRVLHRGFKTVIVMQTPVDPSGSTNRSMIQCSISGGVRIQAIVSWRSSPSLIFKSDCHSPTWFLSARSLFFRLKASSGIVAPFSGELYDGKFGRV